MGNFIRQTIEKKSINMFLLFLSIIVLVFLVNIPEIYLLFLSPLIRSLISLFLLLCYVLFCAYIIFSNLTEYNYKLIGDDFIVERVIGKANHVFVSFKLGELKRFENYDNHRVKLRNIFTNNRKKSNWFYLEDVKGTNVIIEPNSELDLALKEAMKNE